MISTESSKFKDNLNKIKEELDKYNWASKNELLTYCVQDKLKGTLLKYNEDLSINSDYLLTRSTRRVLNAITRIQKANDKADLQQVIDKEGVESNE